jgi:DNA helicase-2/ATP-dependent DNA helicase PcrA
MVFIIGLNEGYLPITYAKTEQAIQEEKRLLYVGITRAKASLRLSFVNQDKGRDRSASRFVQILQAGLAQ